MNTQTELQEICKSYAAELAAIAAGKAWLIDREIVVADEKPEGDDVEPASFCDWCDKHALGDTRFEVGADKTYWGGKILIGFGGPNIWLRDDRICGYWGADRAVRYLSCDACDMVADYLREWWDCIKG